MAENSKISWTHHTLNLWTGCAKVSAGCKHCYAEGWAKRTGRKEIWGPKAERPPVKADFRSKLRKWHRAAFKARERHRVFVGSLMDWAEGREDQKPLLEEFWPCVREYEDLDFLMLTKRPQNIARLLPDDWHEWTNGYPNVWLMTSIECCDAKDAHLQDEVLQRAEHLLKVPAVVHGVSYEPALGPLAAGLRPWMHERDCDYPPLGDEPCFCVPFDAVYGTDRTNSRISWVIYGGESGPGYRPEGLPEDPKLWARQMRRECKAAGVAFFHKQSAAFRNETGAELDGELIHEFPEPRPTEWFPF